MNKIVKTVVILLAGIALTTGTAVAAPRHHVRPVRIHHCAPPPPPPRHHHHHGGHGHVDCGAGLVGGLIGGLVGGIVGAIAN